MILPFCSSINCFDKAAAQVRVGVEVAVEVRVQIRVGIEGEEVL